jgi:hypothetical protein
VVVGTMIMVHDNQQKRAIITSTATVQTTWRRKEKHKNTGALTTTWTFSPKYCRVVWNVANIKCLCRAVNWRSIKMCWTDRI